MRSAGTMPLSGGLSCDQVDERLAAARDVVDRAGAARSRRARSLCQLGMLLLFRYQCRTDRADLIEAVATLRTAAELTSRQGTDRERVERVLAAALCARAAPEDLPEAIALLRRLAGTGGATTLEQAYTFAQLGMALLSSSAAGGRPAESREAMTVLEGALDAAPPPDSRLRRAVVGVLRLGLAAALTGHGLTAAGSDPAAERRAEELLGGVDVALLDQLIPGMGEVVDRVGTALRGLSEVHRGAPARMGPAPTGAGAAVRTPGFGLLHELSDMIGGTTGQLDRIQKFHSDGGLHRLDDEIDALRARLATANPLDPSPGLVMVSLGQSLLTRSRGRRMSGLPEAARDLAEATALADRAVAAHDPATAPSAALLHGQCLLDRWLAGLGSPPDLDDALGLLYRAAALTEPDSLASLASQPPIAEALVARALRDANPDDLDTAETLLLTVRERLVIGAITRQVMAVRLAAVRMVRASGTGDTDDILRASAAIRTATDEVARVSLLWGYDSAAMWARWTRETAPLPEQAEAHRRAVVALHRLARAQLTRTYSEVALRRVSSGLAAHAAYALVRTGHALDAAVVMETGRAVLLTLALDSRRPPLPDRIDRGLRDRFTAAVARLARAEVGAAVGAGAGPIEENRS